MSFKTKLFPLRQRVSFILKKVPNSVDKTVIVQKGVHISPSVTINRHSYINGPNTRILSGSFGSFCSISWGVTIGPPEHPISSISSHPFWYNHQFGFLGNGEWQQPKEAPIIGHDVWIGCNTVVLRGSKIGNGAVIGANSVVTGDIPPYSIAVGSPARIVKFRFDQSTIDKLEELEWWNWNKQKINEMSKYFNSPDLFLKNITKD